MEFFTNGTTTTTNTTQLSQSKTNTNTNTGAPASNSSSERILAGILDTFPLWAAANEVQNPNNATLGTNIGVGIGSGMGLGTDSMLNLGTDPMMGLCTDPMMNLGTDPMMNLGTDPMMGPNIPLQTTVHNNDNASPPRNDFFMNGFMAGLDAATNEIINSNSNGTNMHNKLGPIGVRSHKMSPESNNSSTSISCSWCEVNASMRCVDCNEFMCAECIREHRKSSLSSNHSIISLPTPIGTSPTTGVNTNNTNNGAPPGHPDNINYICDLHNELLRYVCDYCKKLVCQCCTLHEHKEHNYASIQSFVDEAQHKINAALESSRLGTKCIKSSIDKALAFIRLIERNCAELTENIRKAFRQFIIAIEDRERFMLEFVEKMRQRRLATLHDQMAGLKSALTGLAETSEMLQKALDNNNYLDHIDLAMKVTNGQRQLEQFAAIYKDLQPKQEMFVFVTPDFGLLNELRNQAAVLLVDDKNVPTVACGGSTSSDVSVANPGVVAHNINNTVMPPATVAPVGLPPTTCANSVMPINTRRPLLRDNSYRLTSPNTFSRGGSACAIRNNSIDWELNAMRHSPGLHFGAPRSTQAIPGCTEHVKAHKSNSLSLSFANEGHEDGQVSRPWGLCVDKLGNIFVSDRRNNRVQVFNSEGQLKFKFGRKGVGNGEFDLPAGICVDVDNRIIVVDKDNHRVQIFNASGAFLLKFGSYGKEYGQFQYPWDVAVNSRRQIVVTDSRNHRIQQFDSEGRFIRQIVFDTHNQNKGIASPRGVCYTPTGNIIVSDFDNHCLYLIDPDINEIISAKGHEGAGYPEFNRPSGICCDDDGRIIVADSKNQRIVVFSPSLEYLWDIEVRPSLNPLMPPTLDEKDRTCDVALMPDGRIVFLIELSPDSKEGSNPYKRFVHVF